MPKVMKKAVVWLLALVFSLSLASVALAADGQAGHVTWRGDARIAGTADGDCEYVCREVKAGDVKTKIKGIKAKLKDCKQKESKLQEIWRKQIKSDRRGHRGHDRDTERYFYVDANGVSHYFRLDPDKEYDVHAYKDENGVTQFRFEAAGWK